MQSPNPRQIAALIMVDVSPRWITGCTIVEPRQNLDTESYGVARVSEWIGWTYPTYTESGLRCAGRMECIVCVSPSSGFA